MNTEQPQIADPKWSDSRIQVVIAILLGVAAILTAWFSLEAANVSDEVQKNYSTGIRTADEATTLYTLADSTATSDRILFLEFAKAKVTGDTDLAEYIRASLMSPDLVAAISWWEKQPDEAGYNSPFVNENPKLSTKLIDTADEVDAPARMSFSKAEESDRIADDFDQMAIIMAIALFFLGIAGLTSNRRMTIIMLSFGVIILVLALIRAVSLGNPGQVF